MRGKRVAMFVFGYGVWNSSSLLNAAIVLAEQGWQVDIFTDVQLSAAEISDSRLSIDVHVIGSTGAGPRGDQHTRAGRQRTVRQRFRSMLPRSMERTLLALWIVGPRLFSFIAGARRISRTREYAWFIGADTTGLAAAVILGRIDGVPVVYWSLELWLWREAHSLYYRLLKLLEYLFHRRATFTIIPSADWIPLLAAENRVAESRFVVVPATARGPARTWRSDFLRSKLGIRSDQRIVLYAGSLVPWALTEAVARAAREWPVDWVLVLHGWGDPAYLDRVRSAGPQDGRMRLSLDTVAHHELDDLISSADVGIALYDDDVMARRLITSASSKVGQYLKCSVPVIVNDFEWFRDLFARYECGVAVSGAVELETAITAMLEKHEVFRAEAARCFDEQYRFDAYFSQVVRRLDSTPESS